MDIKIIFRSCIVIGTISYICYFFLPYSYGYLDADTANLLSYSGYGALIKGNEVFMYVIFIAWLACSVGLFIFNNLARTLFFALVIITTAITPMFGASVETAGGTLLIDIANIADGAILAMAYLSPVSNEFK